ncbi:hypothetical protein GF362_01665 [Candidatus Dojkabacteria bacterium]|nr:hypothetical protein [Candidatus Dojkabacteria bacterium]
MNIIKPPKLDKGDTIGIVATSFPFPHNEKSDYYHEYQRGIKIINSMGFQIQESKNLRKRKWWAAGTAKERAEDINGMFENQDINAIMVHDGGQSAITILEYLDYDLIKMNPKPFIGFSDVTNILSAIYSKTGIVSFYGPLVTYGFGKHWRKFSDDKISKGKDYFQKILSSHNPLGYISPITEWESWKPGKARGKLFGGNLSMLLSLVGTSYFPLKNELADSILFWEIDNTESYWIERGLYVLKYSGILDIISGMIVGKLPGIKNTCWKKSSEPSPKEIVLEILKEYNFPVMGGFDFGHETIDIPMPIGIEVSMNSQNLSFEILESAVKRK